MWQVLHHVQSEECGVCDRLFLLPVGCCVALNFQRIKMKLCFPGIEAWGAYYFISTWTSSLFGASFLDQAHDGCDILQYDDGVGAMGGDWAYSMNSTELRMQP